MESNPLNGLTVLLFYGSGMNRTAQECDMASVGFSLLWLAQVIKTPSVNIPVSILDLTQGQPNVNHPSW